ncbi:MAG: hypothetical protein FWF11_00790, partial [Coriobacteriia bacterium]|nr:hypothetical protein [Coriobacteriia bacterium]
MVLPFAAAANSSAIQSVITPVLTQVQTLFSAADDVFVPNEAPAVAASGISPFSASNIRLEATTFSAGFTHSLALHSNGTLWAWGSNGNGRTGLGTITGNQLTPAQVGTAANWTQVSAGNNFSLALRSGGTLWSWGSNADGVTGLGTTVGNQLTPEQVGTAANWTAVSAGSEHSLAIRSDGTLWAWGQNTGGRTGLGVLLGTETTPVQVGTATNWAHVSAGQTHSLAVRSDGTLWAWGSHTNGVTGLGTSSGNQTTPAQVGTATNWSAVSAGSAHSLAIRADGTLWSWGSNVGGRTGLGATTGTQTTPVQVGTATDWTTLSAGNAHSIAIRSDGTLWSWGSNTVGRTGLGTTIGSQTTPIQVGSATDWTLADAGTAGSHSLGMRTNGDLWGWGYNVNGQIGLNDIGDRTVPTLIGSGFETGLERDFEPPTIENIAPQGSGVATTTAQIVITFDQAMHTESLGTVRLNNTELDLTHAVWTENDT